MPEPNLVKSQFLDPVGRRYLHRWIAGWKSASSLHRVKLEIDRARRYERPLSVIVLEVPTSVEADLERPFLHYNPFESLRTTESLLSHLRSRVVLRRTTSRLVAGARGSEVSDNAWGKSCKSRRNHG